MPASAEMVARVERPDEELFRKNFVEKGLPVVIAGTAYNQDGIDWDFDWLSKVAGDHLVPVYDWGSAGPTVNDDFVIIKMKLAEAIEQTRNVASTAAQRYSVCQLPIEALPPVMAEYRRPDFLANSESLDQLPGIFRERPRIAMFISFFRGIHWHNGREAVARVLNGRKRFILFHPRDSRFLYPRRFIGSGLSWFDETEAVFCSEIPFEQGIEAIDRRSFPQFDKATPYVADLKPGDALYIPTHWWHFTNAIEPCIVLVHFWDAPLRRWGYPIARRSLLMKPYRKFLYRRMLRFKSFRRNQPTAAM